jgi:hypothetical protein
MSPVEPPPLPVEDYYAILEVSPEATEEAIRSSYRRLARLRHPDKNPSDPNATARFQVVSTARLPDRRRRQHVSSSSACGTADGRPPLPCRFFFPNVEIERARGNQTRHITHDVSD